MLNFFLPDVYFWQCAFKFYYVFRNKIQLKFRFRVERMGIKISWRGLFYKLLFIRYKIFFSKHFRCIREESYSKRKIYIINYCLFDFSSTSEVCNVHYVHPTSTAIPTTCCTCITSQSFQLEVNNTHSASV